MLSRCQQMLSVVLFITCLAEKALYYYTLMQCQAATGAYKKKKKKKHNCSGAAHTDAIWTPFSKPQAGTMHMLRCRINALYFRATQQGPADQTLVQVFFQKL